MQITVAVTPDGRADAVTEHGHQKVFALPSEERMKVSFTPLLPV